MDQLVETCQVHDCRLDAASGIEQVEVRHEPELEQNALYLLGVAVVKVNQSRYIMSDVRDPNGHVIGFVAQLRLTLVVQHGLMQRVDVRLDVLVSQAPAVRLVRLDMRAARKLQVLDIAILAPRGVRLVHRRAKTPREPALLRVDTSGKEVNQTLVEDAFGQTVRGTDAFDEGFNGIAADRLQGRLDLTGVGDKDQVAANDMGDAPSRRVRQLR